MGLSCHPSSVASKLRELGKDHDKDLSTWKKISEQDHEIKRGTKNAKEGTRCLDIPARTPLSRWVSGVCWRAYKQQQFLTAPTTCTSSFPLLALDTATQSSSTTLDTTCLNLVCESDPQSILHNIGAKLLDSRISHRGLIWVTGTNGSPASKFRNSNFTYWLSDSRWQLWLTYQCTSHDKWKQETNHFTGLTAWAFQGPSQRGSPSRCPRKHLRRMSQSVRFSLIMKISINLKGISWLSGLVLLPITWHHLPS